VTSPHDDTSTRPVLAHNQSGAAFPVSILLGGMTGVGFTASDSFRSMISIAELGDARGFTRLWITEHHSMPAASSSVPAVILARLTAHTTRLRLGSGGVMLPNHAPLAVAEQYGMLDALAPGRIDLGLGRAPGTDFATAAALPRNVAKDTSDFADQIAELLGFLGDNFPVGHPLGDAHAVPGPWQDQQNGVHQAALGPSVWLLGSSLHSVQLAGRLGRPYAFAHHLAQENVEPALEAYRAAFRSSSHLDAPYAAISISVAAHLQEREARRQAASFGYSMLSMFRREPFILPAPEFVEQHQGARAERDVLDAWTDRVAYGTPQAVATRVSQLQAATGADEILLTPQGHSLDGHRTTLSTIADELGRTATPSP
jgi:luciferase family oxidoreductase group 1